MKVGIVGAGGVGAACVLAIAARASAREVVLVNRSRARARAVARDVAYGAPVAPGAVEVRDGDVEDLAGAALVMITAGVNERGGGATDRADPQGRLRLLATNADVYRDLVPRVAAAAPEAVLLAVTDPPDPLADLARGLAGHDRVLSTGTFLDSLRFRVHLAAAAGVRPADVEAQVLGEHGTSEVFVWSGARIGGVPARDALARSGRSRRAPRRCGAPGRPRPCTDRQWVTRWKSRSQRSPRGPQDASAIQARPLIRPTGTGPKTRLSAEWSR
jgi:L-lactate dehydrogenase